MEASQSAELYSKKAFRIAFFLYTPIGLLIGSVILILIFYAINGRFEDR